MEYAHLGKREGTRIAALRRESRFIKHVGSGSFLLGMASLKSQSHRFQYLIERTMNELQSDVILHGPEAFESLEDSLGGPKDLIKKEFRKLRREDHFDALQIADDSVRLYANILEADDDNEGMRLGFDGWLKGNLNLTTPGANERGDIVWRYRFQYGRTLVQFSKFDAYFGPGLDQSTVDPRQRSVDSYPSTFTRETAQERAAEVLRFGSPFIESAYRFLRQDDRGCAMHF